MFLHYLAKFKCSYIIIFDNSGHEHFASKSEFFLLKLISVLWATVATFSFRLLWHTMLLTKIILNKEDKALTDNVSVLKGWISMSHAPGPNSTDLNPEDYNVWLEMWNYNYTRQMFHNAKELNQRMLDKVAWLEAKSLMTHNWWVSQMSLCIYLCNGTTHLATWNKYLLTSWTSFTSLCLPQSILLFSTFSIHHTPSLFHSELKTYHFW